MSLVARVYKDMVIEKVPSPEYIAKLYQNPHILHMDVVVQPNKKLSDHRQDAYSYRYAKIAIAANTKEDIFNIYKECMKDNFGFVLKPV